MPRGFVFSIESLAGGLNESAAEMIADNEFAQLDNWYIEGPSVWQRPGYALLGGAYSEEILSIFPDTIRRPVISPDGRSLYFQRVSAEADIWMLTLDTER